MTINLKPPKMPKEDVMSERQAARFKDEKEMRKQMSYAGDEQFPEGEVSEERKGFGVQPKGLLRRDYIFKDDINAREAEDIIIQSKCRGTSESID